MTKQKLELTWIGKQNRPKLEPRILLAIKAPEEEFVGNVKCVSITLDRL